MGTLGWSKPGLEARQIPTREEIAMAALFVEAEGHARRKAGTTTVMITQKNPWRLKWLQNKFGGRFWKSTIGIHRLTFHGSRARGFLMTIFSFVSPDWKKKIRRAL